MQSVVAFKSKDNVYIVSNTSLSVNSMLFDLQLNNIKVIEGSNIIMALTGDNSEIAYLDELADCLPKKEIDSFDKKYIVDNLVPMFHRALHKGNVIKLNDNGILELNLNIILAYQDSLFIVRSNFDVIEIADYIVSGEYDDLFNVRLFDLNTDNMLEEVIHLFTDFRKICPLLDSKVMVVDTKSRIIEEREC